MAAVPTVKVEVAFTTDPDAAQPNWVDLTSRCMGFTTQRGRQYELDTIQPGTLTVRFQNDDRALDPTYTYSPFYPYVLPIRKIRLSATWSSSVYYLFTGYVERWPLSWDAPQWGSVTVTATDGMAALASPTLVASFAQELSGARINDVLAAVSWPTSVPFASSSSWTLDTSALGTTTKLGYGVPVTALDAGQETIQAQTFADSDMKTALAHIQEVAAAERGVFFFAGDGTAVFQDRHHRLNTTSPRVTFADSAWSTSRLQYHDLKPDYDVTHIVNEVKVTATPGGTTQVATDGASRQTYFRRTLALSPPVLNDAAALNQAQYELTLRKQPAQRFSSMTLTPAADINSWTYALGLDIGDKVTAEHTTGASAGVTAQTLSIDSYVESVSHTVGPSLTDWQTTFQLSPASLFNRFFLLDAAQLDSAASAVLAY